ncbi:MAG: cation diffusion facilitator family transporter [Candidatus Omnitrophota bacterium]
MNIHKQKNKLRSTAVFVSLVFSVVIFFLVLGAGIISDSIALLLDASTGFIMVFMGFILRLSIKKIEMPPDRFFNFGYEKFEPFTAVIQGTGIIFSCIIASYFAIQDIIHAENITRYDIPMYVSFLSGSIAMFTALYLRRVSLKTSSNMLKVSSFHWFMDSLFSFAMCLGFLFGFYMHKLGYVRITPYVDPGMALVLATVFIWTPLKLIKHNFRELLDAVPVNEIRSEIEKIVEKHKARAFGIHSIRMRKAGDRVFLDVCFEIHGHTTLAQAQAFVEGFEKDIASQFPKYDIIVYFYPAAITSA